MFTRSCTDTLQKKQSVMDRYEIQKLRDLPIEGVAKRLGLTIKHRRCLCQFHDDHTPSMSLKGSSFRCWSCSAHGGTIDLTMQVLGKSFVESCKWLANEHNVILSDNSRSADDHPCQKEEQKFDAARYARYFEHPWLSPEARRFLFDMRRLHPAVVRFCRLNSFRDWLQIPYYNQQGELIGIQRRYMGNDPSQPRFRFQQGERCHLYCQQVIPLLRPEEPIYIAEGPSDTWALLSSGRKAVGIPSATLLKPNDLLPLAGRECHIYPDADAAGEALYTKLLTAANRIGFCVIRHDLPEGCKDFAERWAGVTPKA